jgi:hypothetical protein
MQFQGEMYRCKCCQRYHEGDAPYVIENREGSFIGWACQAAYQVYLDQLKQRNIYEFVIKPKKAKG